MVELVCEGDMIDDGLPMGSAKGRLCTGDDSAVHSTCDSRLCILYIANYMVVVLDFLLVFVSYVAS